MWPFSCYSYQRGASCLPGLSDVSSEELRWQAYQAQVSGGQATYLETLQTLQDQVLTARREYSNVRASDVGRLMVREISARENVVGLARPFVNAIIP